MGRILGYYYDYVQYVGRINGGGSRANKDLLIVQNASTVPCLSIVPFPLLRLESRKNLNSMLGGIVLLKIIQFPTCHEDMVVFCILKIWWSFVFPLQQKLNRICQGASTTKLLLVSPKNQNIVNCPEYGYLRPTKYWHVDVLSHSSIRIYLTREE